jgi:hypothetical protein
VPWYINHGIDVGLFYFVVLVVLPLVGLWACVRCCCCRGQGVTKAKPE